MPGKVSKLRQELRAIRAAELADQGATPEQIAEQAGVPLAKVEVYVTLGNRFRQVAIDREAEVRRLLAARGGPASARPKKRRGTKAPPGGGAR